MITTMMAPALGKIVGLWRAAAVAQATGSAAQASLLTRLKQSGPLIGAMTKSFMKMALPIAAIAAGIYGLKKLHDMQDIQQQKQQKVNASAKDWSEIIGYSYDRAKAAAKDNPLAGLANQTSEDAKKIKESNKELYDQLQEATGDQRRLVDLAVQEGIKVKATGGTKDDALRAVRASLKAGGIADLELDPLIQKIKMDIDFDDPESVRKKATIFLQQALDDAITKVDKKSWSEKLWGGITGESGPSVAS
jgi:hypothetical protein